jgi:RNA polymerase sigma-70 factor (ECF subfamily)
MDHFEAHRPQLHAVATRMLGSPAEADDALQEAWIRVNRADTSEVDNIGGWLTTVVSRVCLAMLDTRRLAFVLHDLFAVPFEDIAEILDRTPASARQLASRARRRVQGSDPGAPTADRAVVDAFLAAARGGDFESLLAVLHPDVVLRADEGEGALQIVEGARAVATRARFFSGDRVAHPAIVDGAAGLVATEDGTPVAVLRFTVVEGRITAIDALAVPARVGGLDLGGVLGS